MTNDLHRSDPDAPTSTTRPSQPFAAELLTTADFPLPPPGQLPPTPSCRHSEVTDTMISSHDQPDPGSPRGRRVTALLAAAAPLAAVALATASAGPALATAAPPVSTHASAMFAGSDCLAAFGGHQAPKYPECLGD